ncbi:MAG: hypothetical protein LBI53_00085 [Candidatus Peribacteria bacterium]|jgi:hypothetical protein|nr:hypothetical protein [Candidatus Peribacteria bacterium]
MTNKAELTRAIAIKCKFEAAIENLEALQKLTTQDLSPIIKQLKEKLAASNNYIDTL